MTLVGTLLEIHDTFIVRTGPTYIMVPPDIKAKGLVIGEALSVTVTAQGGRWTAERIERGPV
jgi:hypothetical protein